ncbi:DNA binding domain-containing protein, excisionase family [Desulfotomaculum arcticum]|uniref:DNA binding domain-containing protein, excisionase family n=1 Tax=Desulfotruncus arcticus DSM 17038 TaxID=1121424 RepID=A0A1I2N4G3_9FIRM|nr:helix-turn-helix domain-containing protein [Desulfotruncus arcticus]SFF97729.1 DNA binding domain-containing protein, excisionase family [Desulfotomaculum arcticum] [Desulfotruncus arcticus DSM 17038]
MQLYTVPEVAKILRVKKGYVYELIYTKRLKALRMSERRIRVPEESLKTFLKQEMFTSTENMTVPALPNLGR